MALGVYDLFLGADVEPFPLSFQCGRVSLSLQIVIGCHRTIDGLPVSSW